MAKVTKTVMEDGISATVAREADNREEPLVDIFLPLAANDDGQTDNIDRTEHVIINGGTPLLIKRGEHVSVPVSVFLQLRNRYPNL